MTDLEKSIVRTIAYFDLLNYPLTATEAWRWLYHPPLQQGQPPDLAEVSQALEQSSNLKNVIERQQGFYCLRGRGQLINERKTNNLEADAKLKKAQGYAKVFRLFPSVRLVAVCSSLAAGNVKSSSDIDLFIVSASGQIWVTRFLLAGLLKLLNQRPTVKDTKNKICLSYYVTDQSLDLSAAQLGQDDIAFAYYVEGFLPLYDTDGLYQRLLAANSWLWQRLPNANWPNATTLAVSRPSWLPAWHGFFKVISWPFFNGLSRDWVCGLQLRIMPDKLKAKANVDSRVIVTDSVLKFHDQDDRQWLRHQWQVKAREILGHV